MRGQRNRSLSMENSIYTVPGLTRIVRIIEDYIPVKVRFSFTHDSMAEMALFGIARPVTLCT